MEHEWNQNGTIVQTCGTRDFRVRSFVALDSEVVRCGHDLVVLRVIAMESSVSGPREGENNSFIDTGQG